MVEWRTDAQLRGDTRYKTLSELLLSLISVDRTCNRNCPKTFMVVEEVESYTYSSCCERQC